MATFLRATVFGVVSLPASVVCLSATLGAAPQQPTGVPPVSVERIRKELEQRPAPRLKIDFSVQVPVATFRTGVKQRLYAPTLEEELRKEFTLTLLQRQSAEWASKCCGLDIGQLVRIIDKAWERRKLRKIREQITRELAELEAARKAPAKDER